MSYPTKKLLELSKWEFGYRNPRRHALHLYQDLAAAQRSITPVETEPTHSRFNIVPPVNAQKSAENNAKFYNNGQEIVPINMIDSIDDSISSNINILLSRPAKPFDDNAYGNDKIKQDESRPKLKSLYREAPALQHNRDLDDEESATVKPTKISAAQGRVAAQKRLVARRKSLAAKEATSVKSKSKAAAMRFK